MPLVAMTREMGSLGMDVARILESELKVPIVYHEMVNHLADKMRLRKSHVIRLLGGKASLFERLTADKTSLNIYTADEMLQVASKGAVMRGWGAAHLLRPVKHAVRVRICAPFELRVQRMMRRLDTNDRDAVATEIRNSDEAQGAIARRHFDIDWQDPEGYDLSLNTERMSVEQCAEEIIQLSGKPDFIETDRKSTRLNSSHGYISYAVFCLKNKRNVLDSIVSMVSIGTLDAFRADMRPVPMECGNLPINSAARRRCAAARVFVLVARGVAFA